MSRAGILSFPYRFVDKEAALAAAAKSLGSSKAFSIDIEAFCTNDSSKHLGQISLLQMCSVAEPAVFIVDCLSLGKEKILEHVAPVLQDDTICKYMFDCRRDVEALSGQFGIKPQRVLDLQLYHSALQYKLRGTNRRSGMTFVLKSCMNVVRQDADTAVHAAMTLGNRPVWDVRPLPDHFLEYAADDVRHTLMLGDFMVERHDDILGQVERLTQLYVDHYAVGGKVETEADPAPHQVQVDWLERYLGPAGTCAFCGQKGHTEAECFQKTKGKKCTFCGDYGHIATNCFKKHPHLLKCSHCGQLGHSASKCFLKKPCEFCGGTHPGSKCKSPAALKAREAVGNTTNNNTTKSSSDSSNQSTEAAASGNAESNEGGGTNTAA